MIRVALVGALVAVLSGCSGPATRDCSLVRATTGAAVTVDRDLVGLSDLVLRICAGDRCTEHDVALTEPVPPMSTKCRESGPSAQCRLPYRDGPPPQYGSVAANLAEGPVEVSAHYLLDGRTVDVPATPFEAVTDYPNGPDCGGEGTSVQVTLDAAGLH